MSTNVWGEGMSLHTNLADLAERYDAFLIDQFGVLLTGDGAYPFAAKALQHLSQLGKQIILLSNSGRRSKPNEDRLRQLGFARDSYQGVLTSGEAAYGKLESQMGEGIQSGTPVLVWSRQIDPGTIIAGLGLKPVYKAAQAELILLAGYADDAIDLDAYAQALQPAASRGVPCLCTNPDMTILTKTGLTFGPGQIAKRYEDMGGPVEWIGKPHPLIYEVANSWLGDISRDRVLCIGDSPAHDILGGQAAGFKTALVRTGIHANDTLEDLMHFCQKVAAIPDFIIPEFNF
jgi:HAD superfamily hydrolase (TIGR01459 family)